jgi:hypothetical protein
MPPMQPHSGADLHTATKLLRGEIAQHADLIIVPGKIVGRGLDGMCSRGVEWGGGGWGEGAWVGCGCLCTVPADVAQCRC